MRDGVYTLTATHEVPRQTPGSWSATSTFVVQGERFTIAQTEIQAVFPPNLANGTFDGVLPHVVLARRTLPWERTLDTPGSHNVYADSPWLAVLTCDGAAAPQPSQVTAKDLVPKGTQITVNGSNVTGVGTLDPNTLSYGATVLGQLGYGETPDDKCSVVDLPIATFNQIAPAATDLAWLAHLRKTDTQDGVDSAADSTTQAVVVANRIPPANGVARAYLVSLEGMADYLPSAEGTPSPAISSNITTVRLLVYRSWSFTTNDLDQTLEQLLTNLNTPPAGSVRVTNLALPISGTAPDTTQIAQALANQASGKVSEADATVLMQNALLMGYVPMNHHLRHGGRTVSFFRGPLAPLAVPAGAAAFYSGPDAANAYNPQTGLFDVSYGAAWQLGQLLALQNAGMANELYAWKHAVTQQQAMAAEQALLDARLQGQPLFESFFTRRRAALANGAPPLPPTVQQWFANLAGLQGVPFNYLVPDERMLPPESIRFFYVDPNWVDALIDGAFSIGRAAVSENSLEARHAHAVRAAARAGLGRRALNRRRRLAITGTAIAGNQTITGFLIRSQAIAGWPNLRILGFNDTSTSQPINPLRITALSRDTLLCLFDGELGSVLLREPPEQLHLGVEGVAGAYYTTLRSVVGGPNGEQPGQQYVRNPSARVTPCDPAGTNAWACISMRADGQTVNVTAAAATLLQRLTNDFSQVLPNGVTAAEFALEMTKGVVEVEYQR
ncbi:hypothetical protein [Burkholderia ubonensis]|nr:hypothetical protein [Burkholderia ubonensis]